jgi:hypothetical protein
MKIDDINVEQFKSLPEVYVFLDENALLLERGWDISTLFLRYLNQTTDDDEKQKAQWELEFFRFDFRGSRVFSLSYATGREPGEISAYPKLDEFQETAFEYLKQRSADSKNTLLIARYNHLLWMAPKGIKHKKYALIAISNYIQTIKNFYKLFRKDKNRDNLYRIGIIFEQLAGLCNEVKAYLEELKSTAKLLLFNARYLEFYSKLGIVKDMLDYPAIFKKEDFKNVQTIFEKRLKVRGKKSDDFYLIHYVFPVAIKVAIKTGDDVKKWHNEAGLAHLRIAKQETDPKRFWMALDSYSSAIYSFQLASNSRNKKVAEKLYTDLKPKVTLPTHSIFPDEEWQKAHERFQEHLKKLTTEILRSPPEAVYYIISTGYIFPSYEKTLNAVKGTKSDFMDYVTTVYFDKNKNVSRPKKPKQDIDEKKLYNTYRYQISTKVVPYLHNLIVGGIRTGHLTFENFTKYLAENTWLGKPSDRTDLSGEPDGMNWIALLAPAICEYFVQIQAWSSSKYYHPNFILCIDSLTLKMEGLIRDFCERLNIPVSISKPNAMHEAFIPQLLNAKSFKKYFNDDDQLFFSYLFSSEFGLNLRNDIAHSFYNYDDYQSHKMLLLLAALLRIGKYDYTKVE